jgi:hypothetical protein
LEKSHSRGSSLEVAALVLFELHMANFVVDFVWAHGILEHMVYRLNMIHQFQIQHYRSYEKHIACCLTMAWIFLQIMPCLLISLRTACISLTL